MLVGVLHKQSLAETATLLANLDASLYHMLELRLDACRDLTPEGVAALQSPLPVLLTLRSAREGGAWTGSEEERLDMLERLAALQPAWLDVEAFVPAERIARIRALAPNTRIILSFHDFQTTPDNLDERLQAMRAQAPDVTYKIACLARHTPDALRMLLFCKKAREQGISLIGISMGEYGECTRILAPVYHSGLCYCPVEESTAPGQLDAATLRDWYNFPQLNEHTAVYGLLGDPVAQSVGHRYHNAHNAQDGLNAVYVKWRVHQEELGESLRLLAALRVQGASVTMPLKEAVLPFLTGLDETGQGVGAVNTLRLKADGYVGCNTDAAGALAILPQAVTGKRVAVLGAGGAARAIIYEAVRQGASVTVYNRTPGKALPHGLETRSFDRLTELQEIPCHILINTLPFEVAFDFSQVPLRPDMLAYDISYAKPSPFLACAATTGCATLDGGGMFAAQAALQRRYWGLMGREVPPADKGSALASRKGRDAP